MLRPLSTDDPTNKIVGRRPKDRGSSSNGSVNAEMRRLCANPLDRLSEKLLDWDFQSTLSEDKKRPISSVNPTKLPIVFHNYPEYIKSWEPLVIEEMMENVISNFISRGLSGVRGGYLQFSTNEVVPTALLQVDGVFKGNSGNRNVPDSDW